MMQEKNRCFGTHDPLYTEYHDHEWAIPIHEDRALFEMLILEGAQAGLSWITVLKKRENYRLYFYNFEPDHVSKMTDQELDLLCKNSGLIRNRNKIYSTRKNAQVFLLIQKEFGSFDHYIWKFVDHQPMINQWKTLKEIPAKTDISEAISKDLKKRGMSFVGPTIIYAFMQAIGMVDDHLISCFCRKKTGSSHLSSLYS